MNIFLHYGYYEEKFEKHIVELLNSRTNIEKILIPRGNKWKGIMKEKNIVFIPSTPDFVESYDVNKLLPLSREFLEKFSKYESIAMNMLVREYYSNVFNYEEAREKMLKYVRFWHHFLVTEKIDFFFVRYVGQYLFEYVMYAVAKTLDIPTIVCFGDRWGKSINSIGTEVEEIYNDLMSKENSSDIVLQGKYLGYYNKFREEKNKNNVINSIVEKAEWKKCCQFAKKNFSIKAIANSYLTCAKYYVEGKKKNNIQYVRYSLEKLKFYNKTWPKVLIKYACKKNYRYYNKIAVLPDLKKRYIYCALQTAPEIALTPLAGNYDNQMLEIHMLSYCAEKYNIEIYVKEHIYQHWREKKFYDELRKYKNIKLLKTTVNTYELIQNAVATATFTGSCSLEGVLCGIPALIFANNENRALPGSYYVTNVENCEKSIMDILNNNYTISEKQILCYLKAREMAAINTDRCLGNDYSKETEEEYWNSVETNVDFILSRMEEYNLI